MHLKYLKIVILRMKLLFATPIKENVVNYKTEEVCTICSSEEKKEFSKKDLSKITTICNEPLIYNFLFKKRLNGREYNIEDAKSFINWTEKGWMKQEWFVFFIRDSQNGIIAAIDIKSNHTESAEVGFWASKNHPGVITNSTIKLCKLAKKAGYRELYSLVLPENQKSINVLLRADFIQDNDVYKDEKKYLKFEVRL